MLPSIVRLIRCGIVCVLFILIPWEALAKTGHAAATADPAPQTNPSGASLPAAPASPASKTGRAAPPAPAPAHAEEGHPESVEIQVRLLGDRLAEGFAHVKGGGRYERWAVVPFSELGKEVEKRRLGEVVASQLEGALQKDHGFICVERLKLAALMKEVELGQAGVIDESKVPEAGKLAGADVLVVGSVGLVGDRYVVSARAVSMAEGKVLASAQVMVNAAGLIALSSDAVVLRTRSDAVFRSVLIPGWGQWYNRQEQKGTFIMVLTGGLIASGFTFYALGRVAENAYDTMTPSNPGPCAGQGTEFPTCVQNERTTAQSRYEIATGLFIGLGAVYAYNLFDAWLFGYSAPSLKLELQPRGLGVAGTF